MAALLLYITVCAHIALPVNAAPDPHLTARWLRPGVAVISWTQATRGCLATHNVLIGCYDGAGRITVEVGRVGPVDGGARGPVYQAEIDGARYRAEVRGVVYLGVVRR